MHKRLNSGNACYYALQRLISLQLLSRNIKLKMRGLESKLAIELNDLYGKPDIIRTIKSHRL
ncbi:hypothetical protein C0J52_10388 [Blattella germanica]|nr:hypothetical protein C0J52_10388 [Blattella germanica]